MAEHERRDAAGPGILRGAVRRHPDHARTAPGRTRERNVAVLFYFARRQREHPRAKPMPRRERQGRRRVHRPGNSPPLPPPPQPDNAAASWSGPAIPVMNSCNGLDRMSVALPMLSMELRTCRQPSSGRVARRGLGLNSAEDKAIENPTGFYMKIALIIAFLK